MLAAKLFIHLLMGYGAAGVIFATVFVVAGIERVDPVAAHAPVGFRLIVIPGVTALWPWLLVRWVKSARRGASS